VVITDGPRDPVLSRALEALVRELRALGCEARLSSPPAGESNEERDARLGRAREADRVLVLDLAVAADVLRVHGLAGDARMIVADFHLLHRLDAWHAHAGRAWPDARVEITSAFPSYAHLYLNAGIPLSAVCFRPYPVLAAAPEPQGSYVLSAGGHLRDVACLERAAELVAASTSTIRVYHTEASRPRRVGVLDPRGSVPLERLEREISASRFVVLPLVSDRTHANGGTLIAMAHAAGRALVSTAAPCAVDHVRDGEDGILVRPGDARALAEAIERVDRDDALRESLGAGARRAAERASVSAWARELVHGAPPGDAPRAFV
jgi:hypothetical protein